MEKKTFGRFMWFGFVVAEKSSKVWSEAGVEDQFKESTQHESREYDLAASCIGVRSPLSVAGGIYIHSVGW